MHFHRLVRLSKLLEDPLDIPNMYVPNEIPSVVPMTSGLLLKQSH